MSAASLKDFTSLEHSQRTLKALKDKAAREAERASKLAPAMFPAVPMKTHPASVIIDGYDDDETEFLKAIDEFKARTGRRFPLHTDMLAIFKSLGYVRQVAPIMAPPVSDEPNHYHLSKSRRVKAVKERYDANSTAREVAAATGMSERSAKRVVRLAKAFDAEQLEVFERAGTSQEDMTAVVKIADVAKRGEIVALIARGIDTKTAIAKTTGNAAPVGPNRPNSCGRCDDPADET